MSECERERERVSYRTEGSIEPELKMSSNQQHSSTSASATNTTGTTTTSSTNQQQPQQTQDQQATEKKHSTTDRAIDSKCISIHVPFTLPKIHLCTPKPTKTKYVETVFQRSRLSAESDTLDLKQISHTKTNVFRCCFRLQCICDKWQ